jgi:hypothetical protein
VRPCWPFVERLRANGKDISVTAYADAEHVFEGATLTKPLLLAKAQVSAVRLTLSEVLHAARTVEGRMQRAG